MAQTAPANLLQRAQMVAMANRQKKLNKESEQRLIKSAVRDVLKELK